MALEDEIASIEQKAQDLKKRAEAARQAVRDAENIEQEAQKELGGNTSYF